ncbi:FF domain [Dillenia turbinata]|uniref:FF domain n=1 Tax=Dillenia turbinata TaxID=194707 RepID=A0AAN8YXX4_9MAGN
MAIEKIIQIIVFIKVWSVGLTGSHCWISDSFEKDITKMANNHQFPALQFRPVAPPRQPQPFAPQHYQPEGQGVPVMNSGLPPQPPPIQFPQAIQQLPTRPAQQLPAIPAQQLPAIPAQQLATRPAQPGLGPPPPVPMPMPMPMPNAQPLRPIPPALPLSSSYTFAPSSYGPPQPNTNAVTQYQPAPTIPAAGQPWPSKSSQSTGLITPVRQNVEHPAVTTTTVTATSNQPKPPGKICSDWIEHNSSDGRRYYYNRRTKLSSWEKPFDLMTPIERADATTDWKEFTSPDGKKYALLVAREKLANPEMAPNSLGGVSSVPISVDKAPTIGDTKRDEIASSPVAVAPVVAVSSQEHVENMESSSTAMVAPSVTVVAVGTKSPVETVVQETVVLGSTGVPVAMDNAAAPPLTNLNNSASQEVKSVEGVSAGDMESEIVDALFFQVHMVLALQDKKEGTKLATLKVDEKPVEQEPLTYANKQYLTQKKKQDAEERRAKQKKAREEFRKMLEASSQWRKVQDRLEADERCSRLEKIDRLEIFQEYLHDLEKEEEEQRKLQKEELRKAERKNRDDFRKLMEEHVTAGILTAKTHWRDYCLKVKDLPAYLAISSNTSGSTPKDLFEDASEELQNQYHDDKTRVKDATKLAKITLSSTWTFEEFKAAILDDVSSPLIFDELIERVKEKDEKEAKKRKRLADNFLDLLCSMKEITTSSKWEDCAPLLEDKQEFRSIGEESFCRGVFEEYTLRLKEKAKEEERKRKEEKGRKEKEREEKERKKLKERREKDRAHVKERGKERSRKEGADSEQVDIIESYDTKDSKRSGKDKDKKHRKRHQSDVDEPSSDKSGNERSKSSHRSSGDRKKSKNLERHQSSTESESESKRKRHKKDHRNGSRRSGGYEDLEDGELVVAYNIIAD